MWKRLPSVVVAAFIALTLSILLPIAINVVTAGNAPKPLQPLQRFSWPIILFSAIVVIFFATQRRLRVPSQAASSITIHPRNRARALAQVQARISNRLDRSLIGVARIALELTESPGSVVQPLHLMVQRVEGSRGGVTSQTNIVEAFSEMDESLLILGSPGAGKSTMLLELAQNLHAKALLDQSASIPVVLDLARWSTGPAAMPARQSQSSTKDTVRSTSSSEPSPNQPRRVTASRREGRRFGVVTGQEHDFHNWLIRELNYLYRNPRNVADSWLQARQFILLLDGLDEIPEAARDQFVEAINKFQDLYKVPAMAITCRRQDYDRLRGRLTLQGAVEIQRLTRMQITQYLDAAGNSLVGVREALRQDGTLWELLDSPLMLNIMALAYHDRPASEVIQGTTIGDRRKRLVSAYVTEVTTRRQAPAAQYRLGETQVWIGQLAYCASLHRSSMPLRRSWFGWRMPWLFSAPESRVRFFFAAWFPWAMGLSCSIGAVLPLSLHLGSLVALAPSFLLLTVQSVCALLTVPIRRKKHARSVTYARLRRSGFVVGVVVGVSEFAAAGRLYGHESSLATVIRGLVIVAPLICFLAAAGRLENFVSGGLIEVLYWSAIMAGGTCGYLLYRWLPVSIDLIFSFSIAFVFSIILVVIAVAAGLAIRTGDDFRWLRYPIDWRAIVVPVMFASVAEGASALVDSSDARIIPIVVIGVASGVVWSVAAGFMLIVLASLSLFKLVLTSLDPGSAPIEARYVS